MIQLGLRRLALLNRTFNVTTGLKVDPVGSCVSLTKFKLHYSTNPPSESETHDFRLSEEVQTALSDNKPIVAIDTSVLSRTFPYPENKNLLSAITQTLSDNGVVPAPIAIMDGRIHVGLDEGQVEVLAKLDQNTHEASQRDISLKIARKENARTRLSAAMIVSSKLDINILVCGNIGGIVPQMEDSENIDISPELPALGSTPVSVVCAGLRPFIHVENTLQYLNTESIATITFGDTLDFPVFGSHTSGGGMSMANFSNADDIAVLIKSNNSLKLPSGVVIACPTPSEVALDFENISDSAHQALLEGQAEELAGYQLTNFLTNRLYELCAMDYDMVLSIYKNNAEKAALIASALKK